MGTLIHCLLKNPQATKDNKPNLWSDKENVFLVLLGLLKQTVLGCTREGSYKLYF